MPVSTFKKPTFILKYTPEVSLLIEILEPERLSSGDYLLILWKRNNKGSQIPWESEKDASLIILELGKFWNLGNLGPVRSEVDQPVMLDCPDIDSMPEARFNWFKVTQDGDRQLLRSNGKYFVIKAEAGD